MGQLPALPADHGRGHGPVVCDDDHPDADVLALWAGKHGINRGLGGLKPSKARNRIIR